MIAELSMRVKPKNKYGMIAFLLSLTVGVFLIVFSETLDSYRGVVGAIAVLLFVYALFAYTRYVVREYYYDITVIENEPLLVVRQLIGSRSTTMCRISLSDITKVETLSLNARGEHKTPTGYLKYNYTVTMFAPSLVRLTVNSRYEKCEILLEGGVELAELLNNYSNEARALNPVDSE